MTAPLNIFLLVGGRNRVELEMLWKRSNGDSCSSRDEAFGHSRGCTVSLCLSPFGYDYRAVLFLSR